LQEPLDALYGAAGGILVGDGLGFGGRDEEQNRRFGRDWFESRSKTLRSTLCGNVVARDLSGDLANDILMIVPILAARLDGNLLLAAIVAGIVEVRDCCRTRSPHR